jgi:hypothetical protein
MSAKKRQRRSGRRFIQLWTNVKRSAAYHGLGVYGRSALFELLDRYNGCNNGMIGLGCRELANALNCSPDTAAKALRELDDSGLARPITGGVWRGKRATEWRLTFYRCDKTGELPVLNWPPCQSAEKDTKVRVEGHKASLSPCGRTQTPKSSTARNPVSPVGRTHVDIYQGGTDSVMRSERATQLVSNRPPDTPTESQVFGPKFEDPRIVALNRWGGSKLKQWAKPTIVSDEPRDSESAAESAGTSEEGGEAEPYPDLPAFLNRRRVQ